MSELTPASWTSFEREVEGFPTSRVHRDTAIDKAKAAMSDLKKRRMAAATGQNERMLIKALQESPGDDALRAMLRDELLERGKVDDAKQVGDGYWG